jgi:hypothetical protein
LRFALGRDKAVANAPAVTGYERAQSNMRRSSSLKDQHSRRWVDFSPNEFGSVFRGRRSLQRALGNDGPQLVLRALNAQTSPQTGPTQPCRGEVHRNVTLAPRFTEMVKRRARINAQSAADF